MQVKFKAPMFDWLKEKCKDQSIPAYLVELVQKEMDGPYKGVDGGKEKDSCTEQLHKSV